MPAVTTSGFNVGVMPQVQFADPRLLTPQYASLIPAAAQGLQVAQQFQMAPLQRELAQIKLEQEREQLAQAPLREQLAALQLTEAQKRAAVPEVIAGDITLENAVSPYDYPALDENGQRTAPMPLGDLVQITQGERVGPGGVMTPFTQRKTLKTAEQREAEAAKAAADLDAARALADYRRTGRVDKTVAWVQGKEAALQSADEAEREGRADEAKGFRAIADNYQGLIDKAKSSKPVLTAEDFYDRRVAQLAAEAGITYDRALEMSRTPSGSEALATAAVANKAASKNSFMAPTLTKEQKAMIAGTTPAAPAQDFTVRVNEALGGAGIPTLTVAEAVAAPVGTIFIGIDGKKRKKNLDGTVSLIVQ